MVKMKQMDSISQKSQNRREPKNLKPLSSGINENNSRSAGLEIISQRGRAYQTAGVYFPGGLIRTLPEKKSSFMFYNSYCAHLKPKGLGKNLDNPKRL
ncbi:MAG: hypothetical protein ACP5G4_06490 [bacterium]